MYNKYLKTFITVVDEGSFTKASEKLILSPTAIMKQINSLEDTLNITLLNRTHKGISLTQGGKIIYDAGKKIIKYANKEEMKAKNIEKKDNETIIIGTSVVCPCKPLIDIWYKISKNFPKYKIKIVPFEENHTNTLISLKNQNTTFDCIVTPCDSNNWLKEVNFLKLGDTSYTVTVPIDHKFANKKEISIKDLKKETVMIPDKGDSKSINNIREKLIENNIKIEAIPFFYDIDVFNKCVSENNVLISLEFWNNIHPSLTSIPLKEKSTIPYGVIYSKAPRKGVKKFIKLIEENQS